MARHRQTNRRQVRPFTPGSMPAIWVNAVSAVINGIDVDVTIVMISNQGGGYYSPPFDIDSIPHRVEAWVLDQGGIQNFCTAASMPAIDTIRLSFAVIPSPEQLIYIDAKLPTPAIDDFPITCGVLTLPA